jgi:pyridoxine 5-phosphate synthase
VPEKREERTTEGGLNLLYRIYVSKLRLAIADMRKRTPASKISLFIEADVNNIEVLKTLGVDAVEIHTGDYAKAHLEANDISKYLDKYAKYYELLKDTHISFHAGHGLTDESLKPLCNQGLFIEYNIGHWIISESVYIGMDKVIKNLLNIMES